MKACPACDRPGAEAFLRRPGVPVHQNLLCDTAEAARAVPRGDIELALCGACGLVFNAAFDPGRLSYTESYDSNQSHSAVFLAHVDALVERLLAEGVRGRRVVEVGCGSGYFLRRLCAHGRNQGLGYDPGYRGPERDSESGARFVRALFAPAAVPDAEVLVCRHVIEHVPRPVEFVRGVTEGLALQGGYFETPSFEWIVSQAAVWDVFYEHCNYFSEAALQRVFRAAGLVPGKAERVFGGQYFWLATGSGLESPPAEPLGLPQVLEFARRCAAEQRQLAESLERLAAVGRVAVWGAAAKGSTYVNLLDPGGTLVRCLTDVSPARHGHYVPGSGHAIVPPAALGDLGVSDVIVMNPNYLDEVGALLRSLGFEPRVHTVGAP